MRKMYLYLGAIVIFTPILLGLLLNIPTGFLTIGDESAWVGFFGNYSGGIIGGIVALLVASFQVKKESQYRNREEAKKHEYTIKIIERFIFQEMRDNLSMINEHTYLALENRAEGKQTSHGTNYGFIFTTYYELRYELAKNLKVENQKLFEDIIEFYEQLRLIKNKPQIDDLSRGEAKTIVESLNNWIITLDSI
ncbi:hypothetical protein ACZ11_07615 [Lysinibacillus xylanilyticus]|uniref:DUF4760 domain-containing protein n=1 Tax=Lysinibacillus xylanilyticus TaxID=582475 RepID=A0A0K9FBU6_9BACI|nr:hypothetical protein [Lysinibacillus xylanilyticus]KMY32029.1 hypothetical protein ACZ11_07615 [Lysinibacillus xylanilyticus]